MTQLLAVALRTHPNNGGIDERLEANETRVPVVGCSAVDGVAQTAGCTQGTTTVVRCETITQKASGDLLRWFNFEKCVNLLSSFVYVLFF